MYHASCNGEKNIYLLLQESIQGPHVPVDTCESYERCMYCIQGKMYVPLLLAGKFKTGRIPLSQIVPPSTQLHLGEFKIGQSHLHV